MSEIQFPLLAPDQIEVKVKKCSEKGALLLLYKTARTDMDMLDRVVGVENWDIDYKEIKGNLYAGIGIKTENGWIRKWDCGIESRSDGDGNEKKGEASDAAKRSGTRWGIGRELYTSPFIFARVKTRNEKGTWKLENPFQRFEVAEIGYSDDRKITSLRIVDNDGNNVFTYGGTSTSGKRRETPSPKQPAQNPQIQGPRMATQEQIEYLTANATEDQCLAMMSKYGAGLERLTYATAEKLIAKLGGAA